MDNDDLGAKKVIGAFVFIWVFSALASLGIIGVAIWAVIKLVNHFTGG